MRAVAVFFVILNFYQEIFTQVKEERCQKNSFKIQFTSYSNVFISNLDNKCLRCLCVASSNCDMNFGCQNGFCGPHLISHAYYLDAAKNTDMVTSKEAFETCSLDYNCARKVVKHYVARFARDCNQDGVTDCTDFAMINFNGGYGCELDLFRSPHGRQYAERYYNCSI